MPEEVGDPSVTKDDEQSVFANLASQLEGLAAEAETSSCNLKVIAPPAQSSVRLPPCPSVSCRITPTGETVLSLQWEQK